nr:guanylyl cyclase-activating protein 3-like [Oncorhynchus nerka]
MPEILEDDQDPRGWTEPQGMAIQDITRCYDPPTEEIVTLIYEKVDINNEGELTLEEFIEGARDHQDIMEMLGKMMDLTNVLKIIVNGQKKQVKSPE